jgi:hypothetical protein
MMTEVDGTIRLADEYLSHKRGGECTCDGTGHHVSAMVDLAAVLERATTDDSLTADVFPEPWEKAVQLLHEQAGHATAYAVNCREPGCAELYGIW